MKPTETAARGPFTRSSAGRSRDRSVSWVLKHFHPISSHIFALKHEILPQSLNGNAA
jgi:hypothetical protein